MAVDKLRDIISIMMNNFRKTSQYGSLQELLSFYRVLFISEKLVSMADDSKGEIVIILTFISEKLVSMAAFFSQSSKITDKFISEKLVSMAGLSLSGSSRRTSFISEKLVSMAGIQDI